MAMTLKLETLEDVRDWHAHLAAIGDMGTGAIIEAIAENNRKAVKIIDAHLSAQAKVRVTDEDAAVACDAYEAEYNKGDLSKRQRTMLPDQECTRAALESFAARLSQGAQGEAVAWIHAHEVDVLRERQNNVVAAAIHPKTSMPDDAVLLYTQPAERTTVPDGWVLVPIQFTPEMREAGAKAIKAAATIDEWVGIKGFGGTKVTKRGDNLYKARMCWQAMLTAAPQPPEGARVVDGWLFYFADDDGGPHAHYCGTRDEVYAHVAEWMTGDRDGNALSDAGDDMIEGVTATLIESGAFHPEGEPPCFLRKIAAPTLAGKEGA